jgi:hypothetical protein
MLFFACDASSTVGTATSSPTIAPTATATVTPTPAPSASVVQVAHSQHFADSMSGGKKAPCANGEPLINGDCGETVTATCAGGDVLLGGGWAVDDFLAFVTSSYPSSATAWTVTAHDEGQDGGSHAFTITAYAECLHGNFSPGISAVSATPSIPKDSTYHEKTVNCPSGSVVTGGGFRGTNGTGENIPAANGWTAGLGVQLGSSASPSLYALCATAHLSAGSHPKTTSHPVLGKGADLTVGCPAASMLLSGGVQTVGFGNITGLLANGALTQWLAHIKPNGVVGGPPSTYTVTDYAVCVKVS